MPRVGGGGGGRSGGGSFQGNFGMYPASMTGGDYPDDEEAIAGAVDEMFSMCGNAGQETLIGDLAAEFDDWALAFLEEEGAADDFDTFAAKVIGWYGGRIDKWHGTDQIWQAGYQIIAGQSGYHDGYDEQGEGTGQEV